MLGPPEEAARMQSEETLVIGIIALIAIAVVFPRLSDYAAKRQAQKKFKETMREVLPVWASLGPFENGAQSEEALLRAFIAVRGPEKAEEHRATLAGHATIFEREPVAWEKSRTDALPLVNNSHHRLIKRAKRLEI